MLNKFIWIFLLYRLLYPQIILDELHNWNGEAFPDIQFTDVNEKNKILSEIEAENILIDFWHLNLFF